MFSEAERKSTKTVEFRERGVWREARFPATQNGDTNVRIKMGAKVNGGGVASIKSDKVSNHGCTRPLKVSGLRVVGWEKPTTKQPRQTTYDLQRDSD